MFGRVFGIGEISRVYDNIRNSGQTKSIADRLLDFLEISYTTSESDLAQIPASGAAIVTVNHPFGILDGAILASLLTKIRPDVRFVANGILSVVPELGEMVIPVDDPSEPCYESETVQLLKEIKERAERGDVGWLAKKGKVYAAVGAA